MFNILLTDDEQIVIDSLSFIINKNFADSVNVFTAHSGTEAIEIVMKENIDILFMDINMPGLSGLETASVITKLKPNIIFVILSAFDRFQYAQEAINLGAYKYITKPVNRNVVIETIRGAIDLVDKNKGKLTENKELQQKLDLVSPMIENDFIYACIFNNDKALDISAYLEYFNLTESPWVFTCFEFPHINSENQYDTYLKIHELMNQNQRCLVSAFMMNRIVAFFPLLSKSVEYSEVQERLKKLFSILSFNISNGIRAGVSSITSDTAMLQASYNEALSILNKVDSTGGILFADTEQIEEQKHKVSESEFKHQIIAKLSIGDSSGSKTFLELYVSDMLASNLSMDRIKNKLFELMVTAKNSTKELIRDFESETFDNAFSILTSENEILRLKDYTQKMLFECCTAITNITSQKNNPAIQKVCDYVDAHLQEDISLEQMADYVNVSSFYLSKLFKEEKGVTFINFISDKRLEKARQMLAETELSIKEITAEIGYNDQNYFSRIFKNKYGVSPKEYRKVK